MIRQPPDVPATAGFTRMSAVSLQTSPTILEKKTRTSGGAHERIFRSLMFATMALVAWQFDAKLTSIT
ncbi:hypothetical protein D6833_08230 [Candidatus Parcubacteria bacterium]|nr:MAG: hypothetical protein D6833_08230 [Candidatus Parcubacteria bacterium]